MLRTTVPALTNPERMRFDVATDPVCKIDDCGNPPVNRRGWCQKHYLRWWRHGDPLGGGTSQGATQEWVRDAARYDGDDCLIWPFSTTVGYGQTWWDGKPALASRVVCTLAHGPAPTPLHQAAHSCGKGHKGCVSPRHLRWATRKENETDKTAHGTRGKKLSPETVMAILSLRDTMSGVAIARKFGTTPSNVSSIFRGKSWRGVGAPLSAARLAAKG